MSAQGKGKTVWLAFFLIDFIAQSRAVRSGAGEAKKKDRQDHWVDVHLL